jgi:hypothetical protein
LSKLIEEAIGKDVETTCRGDGLGPDVGLQGDAQVPRRTARLEIAGNRAAKIEDSAFAAAFNVAA